MSTRGEKRVYTLSLTHTALAARAERGPGEVKLQLAFVCPRFCGEG